MSFWPFFRSPFTDLTAHLVNHQNEGRCADFEMRFIDCMEAYGIHRGFEKCDLLLKDFAECAGREKQSKRIYAMRMERQRQYYNGERSKAELYAPPPRHDSF